MRGSDRHCDPVLESEAWDQASKVKFCKAELSDTKAERLTWPKVAAESW